MRHSNGILIFRLLQNLVAFIFLLNVYLHVEFDDGGDDGDDAKLFLTKLLFDFSFAIALVYLLLIRHCLFLPVYESSKKILLLLISY